MNDGVYAGYQEKLLQYHQNLRLHGLDDDFYNHLFFDILDLNEITLQRVANNYLADNIIEVTVG